MEKEILIPNEKGYTFTTDDYPYIIQECNVLNKLILYRKDNLPLSSNDTLSPRTIDLALYIYMKDYMKPKEKKDVDISYSLSEDSKYLIMTIINQEIKEHDTGASIKKLLKSKKWVCNNKFFFFRYMTINML